MIRPFKQSKDVNYYLIYGEESLFCLLRRKHHSSLSDCASGIHPGGPPIARFACLGNGWMICLTIWFTDQEWKKTRQMTTIISKKKTKSEPKCISRGSVHTEKICECTWGQLFYNYQPYIYIYITFSNSHSTIKIATILWHVDWKELCSNIKTNFIIMT